MSGLCMAATLRRAGYHDFTLYEKADEVGGTWRENTYPGLSCDVPARFYSYSFAPNPDWTATFASGPEIQAYFTRFADSSGLREHIRFGTEVTEARWDRECWQVSLSDGDTDVVDVLVSAAGVLHHPKLPAIAGLQGFAGAAFHSARWDHSAELAGQRVGVIGTGSTGAQIVSALAGVAGRLTLFQRTAQWVFPMPIVSYSRFGRALMRRFRPLNRASYRFYQQLLEQSFGRAVVERGWRRRLLATLCRLNLRLGVRDKELRRKLTPPDQPMCKRLIISGRFYRAVTRHGVDVVTDAIDHIEPEGVVTADGVRHELDVLVLATGFDAHAYLRPINLIGEDGVKLEQVWADGPRAYRTVALPGFPNFFMLMGPNSPIGNHSLIAIAETQAGYIVRWVDQIARGDIRQIAPTERATDEFNAAMREAMPDTVWTTGCQSWYLGKDGLPELWPWAPARHREMLAGDHTDEFVAR